VRTLRWTTFCATISVASLAHADGGGAEQLFDEGRQLMNDGAYAQACPKLAASYALDPALGTLLNLALCHERIGRIATAWLEYERGIAGAESAHDDDRVRFATQRAALLERHVPHMTIHAPALAGLVVTRDGAVIDASSNRVPIDPGPHAIEARALGHVAWSVTREVPAEGGEVVVEVPELAREPEPRRTWSQRNTGVVLGGAGSAFVVAGAIFGALAISRWSDAQPHCQETPNGLGCDPTGLSLASDASTFAAISTTAFIIGAAGLATGIIVWLTAPRARTHVAWRSLAIAF
jgi:hypothetical protein